MYYIIYKTTNTVNNKVYIGKHKTKDLDDGYLGSGKFLQRAIEKYGVDNFTREIIHLCKTEDDMNTKEREIVTEEFCLRKDTYNLCVGGHGGFSYINRNNIRGMLGKKQSDKQKQAASNFMSKNNLDKNRHKEISSKGGRNSKGMLGKTHSLETRDKMKGPRPQSTHTKNSQYGSIWITNGKENNKIKKNDIIPESWYKGRTMRP
jgi:hypothetical protein